MKRIPIRFFLSLCLASFVFGALTLSSAGPSAHAQSGPIRVTYADTQALDFHYGDCIPLSIDGHPADTIDTTVLARVYLFSDADCQDRADPTPIIMPPGVHSAHEFGVAGSLIVYEYE